MSRFHNRRTQLLFAIGIERGIQILNRKSKSDLPMKEIVKKKNN